MVVYIVHVMGFFWPPVIYVPKTFLYSKNCSAFSQCPPTHETKPQTKESQKSQLAHNDCVVCR